MRVSNIIAGCAVVIAAVNACSQPAPGERTAPNIAPAGAPAEEPNDPQFHADLLRVAQHYASLLRADGTWWSPFDCRAPIHPAFLSRATSGGHGRKIYTLFVKDLVSYAAINGHKIAHRSDPPPVRDLAALSQVIVKEAWTPVPTSELRTRCPNRGVSYLAPIMMDGTSYSACEQAGLFVMYRAPTVTEGTDEGWVYGTIQFDASPGEREGETLHTPRVTSAGRVRSCMRCHERAPHGRLFGMQGAPSG